jgi:hypothetical protein
MGYYSFSPGWKIANVDALRLADAQTGRPYSKSVKTDA